MAIVEKPIGGETGVYEMFMLYDDQTLRPTGLRGDLRACPFNVVAELVQSGDYGVSRVGRKHGSTFLAGTDTTIPIATTTALRLQLQARGDGRLEGVAKHIAPAGRA